MSDQFLMLFTKFSGFRLVVLANRLGCENDFQRKMHDDLIEVLEGLAGSMQYIMRETRRLQSADLSDPDDTIDLHLLEDELRMFDEQRYELLDDLEIDYDTMEYRVNGDSWCCAYSADCDGLEIAYPRAEAVGRDELGSLVDIMADIRLETGVSVSVTHVIYD